MYGECVVNDDYREKEKNMTKNEIEIQRPDGSIERIDVTSKIPSMSSYLLRQSREQTANAGRGQVLRAFVNGVEFEEGSDTSAPTSRRSGKGIYHHSFSAEARRSGDINKFNTI